MIRDDLAKRSIGRFWCNFDQSCASTDKVRVKICNVQNLDTAYNMWELGVDAIGVRGIGASSDDLMKKYSGWLNAIPSELSVFFLMKVTDIGAICEFAQVCRFDTVQIQGQTNITNLAQCAEVLRPLGLRIVKSIGVNDLGPNKTIEYAKRVAEIVDAIILDSTFAGGRGISHDWDISKQVRMSIDIPIILAGGLHANNLCEALQIVSPFGVDVETGSEAKLSLSNHSQLTVKSFKRIYGLIQAVRKTEMESKRLKRRSVNQGSMNRLVYLNQVMGENHYEGWGGAKSLWQVIDDSTRSLAEAQLDADTAILASSHVTYITRIELDSHWRNCGQVVEAWLNQRQLGFQDVYWLQVENEEHVSRFFSVNRYPGRSEPIFAPPVRYVEAIWSLIKNVISSPQQEDVNRLRYLNERRVWILLWDLNLSGRTVSKELQRLLRCRRLLPGHKRSEGYLLIVSAVATHDAIEVIQKTCEALQIRNVVFVSGRILGSESRLQSHEGMGPEERQQIQKFCENFYTWAIESQCPPDSSLRNVGPFGFDNGGYLVVTQENTPNNSLPFLWYCTEAYSPPFLRTASRTHGHISHPPRDLDALSDQEIEWISHILNLRLEQGDSNHRN